MTPFPPLRIPIYCLHGVSQQTVHLSGEADENDSAIEGDFRAHEVGPCGLCAQQGACHGIARICGRHSVARGRIVGAMCRHVAERRGVGTRQDTGLMAQAALDAGAGTWNIEMSQRHARDARPLA